MRPIIVVLMLAFQGQHNDPITVAAEKFMNTPGHVGLSIGIIKNGKRSTYHFGSTQKETQRKPNDQTGYEIASVTKTFTGIILAHAIQEGKLNLTDNITKFTPTLKNLKTITIKDLACHTAGLPKFIPEPPKNVNPIDYWTHNSPITETQFLKELENFKPQTQTTFLYSNADTQLLGIILERIYKKRYTELLKEYITIPANMKSTGLKTNQLAKGYNSKGEQTPNLTWWDNIPAAASLRSNIADMLSYVQLNLNENDPAITLAHRPETQITEEGAESIGLYWLNGKTKAGRRKIFHAGGSAGHTSLCVLYPETKTGIVILTNDAGPNTEKELKAMADEIINALD